jgi:hypothetical protein
MKRCITVVGMGCVVGLLALPAHGQQRVKANTPGRDDGELDGWIDGEPFGAFRNINWRSTDRLRINKVQLSLWLEPQAYPRHGGGTTRTVWYDDVVVATRYIGPKVP